MSQNFDLIKKYSLTQRKIFQSYRDSNSQLFYSWVEHKANFGQ